MNDVLSLVVGVGLTAELVCVCVCRFAVCV